MKKITHHEKIKKIKQYKSWILPLEKRLERLKDIKNVIPNEIENCNYKIEEQRQQALSFYKEFNKGTIPIYINNHLIEQCNFTDVKQATFYIEEVLEKSYDVVKYGNGFINQLIMRALLEIEMLKDHHVEIQSIQLKLEKHLKSLKKVQNTNTTSKQNIEECFKIKEDHIHLIKKTQQKIEKKYQILKTHLYHLDDIRTNMSIASQIIDGSYNRTEYQNDDDFQCYKNRILGSGTIANKYKVQKWIQDNIKEIRKLKSKLFKFEINYEKYLLQTGSEGEKVIRHFLIEYNIIFEEQRRFETCVDKLMLPFDFCIESHKILIEFDGAQHYMPISLFGGEAGFIDRKYKDSIKTEWASKNNYQLIRICFDEDLSKALENLKKLFISI